jgi:predicted esterase
LSDVPRVTGGTGPHAGRRIAASGAAPGRASHLLILLHGRGGSPEDMTALGAHLALPEVAVLAPEAAGRSWWPASFLAPIAANEPGLSSGLSVVEALLDEVAAEGIAPGRVVLAGFSQGACLAVEAAARLARPVHAVAALSGALVGTADGDPSPRADLHGHGSKAFDYADRLDGMSVLLGCHERDPHIPLARVRETASVLTGMGADIRTMILAGAGHGIVAEEIAWLRARMNASPP